jgi:endonuclease/exonuclease/phosphatase (EEP) superfamily protein YafD
VRESFWAAEPEVELRVPGAGVVRVKGAHPPPPTTLRQARDWREQIRALPGPRAGAAPRILAGDLNGTLDHREVRRLIDRGWFDAADAAGEGLRATWPVGRRRPGLAIDHILVPPPIRVRRVTVHEVRGSDHRAVIAELVLP